MKWLLKWTLRLIILIVALVVIILLTKDAVLRSIAEHRIRKQTGMTARIGKLSAGLFSPVVTVENLRLYNTAEFGGTPFLIIPELHIECDPVALAQQKLRIKLMRLHVAELDVVRNEAGKTNVFSLIEDTEKAGGTKRGAGMVENFDFVGVDVLNLSLGKAKYVDLKEPSNNREITIDLQNQIFKDVKSEADVYGILFIIWLRSGGTFSIKPRDLARDFIGRKLDQVEATVRTNLPLPAPVRGD